MDGTGRHGSSWRLALLLIAVVAAVILMVAAPASSPAPEPVPPISQTQVAPLISPAQHPPEVLVPGELGRALSPFLAIVEGETPGAGGVEVLRSDDGGVGYSPAP